MFNRDYNGWVNKETWNIHMMYQETFECMAEEQKYDDIDHMADSFEAIVAELEFDSLKEGTLAHQAVGEYLERVSWAEIAGHYFEEEAIDTAINLTGDDISKWGEYEPVVD